MLLIGIGIGIVVLTVFSRRRAVAETPPPGAAT
jgi:hypothetical protein